MYFNNSRRGNIVMKMARKYHNTLCSKQKYLLYGGNIWYFAEGMFGPLFVVFTERIGGDLLNISWAWAVYLFFSGASIIVIGKISDRINKEWTLMAGYILNAALTFCYLFIDSPTQLLFLQAALGFASALATPTWDAIYDEHSGDGTRDGVSWGIADGTPDLVVGAAILIGSLIVAKFSFAALFITMGVLQVVSVIVQAGLLFARCSEEKKDSYDVRIGETST